MFPSTKGKTYTCGKCGKVGTDFGEMARELCPADVDASHQIPIFGDRLKHPDLVESKANEDSYPSPMISKGQQYTKDSFSPSETEHYERRVGRHMWSARRY